MNASISYMNGSAGSRIHIYMIKRNVSKLSTIELWSALLKGCERKPAGAGALTMYM